METSDEIMESVDCVCFDSAELVSDVGFTGLTLLVGFLSKLPSQCSCHCVGCFMNKAFFPLL